MFCSNGVTCLFLTIPRYQELVDFPIIDFYRRLGFEFISEFYEQVSGEYIREYLQRIKQCKLQSGARQALQILTEAGLCAETYR